MSDRYAVRTHGLTRDFAAVRAVNDLSLEVPAGPRLRHRPKLVFLAEPTAGLDPEATISLREDIAGLVAREGTTVFLTTHNLAEAEKVCGAVGVIRGGRLVAQGAPAELRARVSEPQI